MKASIRFFDDREIQAVWEDQTAWRWFSMLDTVSALRDEDDYQKTRNYWKDLKARLKREGNQRGSATTQFKFMASDGKKRLIKGIGYYYEQEDLRIGEEE